MNSQETTTAETIFTHVASLFNRIRELKLEAADATGTLTKERKAAIGIEVSELEKEVKFFKGLSGQTTASRPSPSGSTSSRVPPDLPTYKEGRSIIQYIKKLESLLKTEDFPVERWTSILPRCFNFSNAHFIESRIVKPNHDWATAKGILIAYFGIRPQGLDSIEELARFRQRSEEHMIRCVNRFREAAEEVNCGNNNLNVALFLKGISLSLRKKLESSSLFADAQPNYPDLESVLLTAIRLDDSPVEETTNSKDSAASTQRAATNNKSKKFGNKNDEILLNLEIEQSAGQSNSYVADIAINNYEVRALIDSGSSISVLNDKIAHTLDIKTKPNEGEIRLAAKNTSIPRRKTSDAVTLECGQYKFKHQPDIISFPQDSYYDFIIGRDLMPLLDIQITHIDSGQARI